MKKNIAILFGGCSTECPVSLQSAASVISHLDREKYEPVLIGMTRQGNWLHFSGAMERIMDDSWFFDRSCVPAILSPSREIHGMLEFMGDRARQMRIDAAFPVLHGKNGEDGTVQGLLALAGIPCVGCGTLSSALCMDKDIAHVLARASGIRVPDFLAVREKDDIAQAALDAEKMGYPLFVKPSASGSSFGITKVHTRTELCDAVRLAFVHDSKVVIEQAIDGFEVGCAVMGNRELIVGEVDEIELSQGFFDYTEKYGLITSRIHMPARISAEKAAKVKETAKKLYRILECRGFARVDMFLTPCGEIVFNEINTIPGFTSHSRFPSMLGGIGIAFGDIVSRLIELALEGEYDAADQI